MKNESEARAVLSALSTDELRAACVALALYENAKRAEAREFGQFGTGGLDADCTAKADAAEALADKLRAIRKAIAEG